MWLSCATRMLTKVILTLFRTSGFDPPYLTTGAKRWRSPVCLDVDRMPQPRMLTKVSIQ